MASAPPDPSDLVDTLAAAASAAVRSQRRAILEPTGRVRGLTVELTLSPGGQVQEAVAYVETRVSGPALLAMFRNR